MAVLNGSKKKPDSRRKPVNAALVQPMPTDKLWSYRSSDNTQFIGQQDIYSDIKASMRRHGAKGVDPVFVEYDPVYRTALVVDGQKRLVAARELGLKKVLVGIVSVCRPPSGYSEFKAKKVMTAKTERLRSYQECERKGWHDRLVNPYDVLGR